MRVLNVNVSDQTGSRFNNISASHALAQEGIDSRFLVWKVESGRPDVSRIFRFPGSRRLARNISKIERAISTHADLHLQSFILPMHSAFQKADVVHYHVIYDGYFSIRALPYLSDLKPSVWTFHDPWPMTGHCIYPMACERWKTGCGACPDLAAPFPMKRDRTRELFRLKKRVLKHSNFDVIVASDAMKRMADQSPIASRLPKHVVPFGVNLTTFQPRSPASARSRLGVDPDAFVIAVRAMPGAFKGYDRFVAALDHVSSSRRLSIITTDYVGDLNKHIGRHQIVELGWVKDDQTMQDIYAACDLFVMPSRAEAFGMMAIEAMASGRPVLVTDDSWLPEVVHAPYAAAVSRPDPASLGAAISGLIADNGRRLELGARARLVAETQYDERIFAKHLADVYRRVYERRGGRIRRGRVQ